MQAHQRIQRDQFAASDPRQTATSLAGYSLAPISRAQAIPLILRYEWLGNIGKSTLFVGLLSPASELHGAACFGYGPAGTIRQKIGTPALCLERGACVHYAPRNAASFLINGACKLVRAQLGVERFFAYADPNAGEYGGVYQAAGWVYLGQGLQNQSKRKDRSERDFMLPPGADPEVEKNWVTSRVFRRGENRLKYGDARNPEPGTARALGWQIVKRPAKHVYAIHVGRPADRRQWRSEHPGLPYPAPRPELKSGGAS